MLLTHEKWMRYCLELAAKAQKKSEVPVGACLVGPEGLISVGYNLRENLQATLAHAEIFALHQANKKRKSWRLEDCTLYVTLEPCLMCSGAILQSRLGHLVFGAYDRKGGAVRSLYRLLDDDRLNHRVQITEGILELECSQILTSFFKNLRQSKKK
jgi:tRNA(adenine34) deaminase